MSVPSAPTGNREHRIAFLDGGRLLRCAPGQDVLNAAIRAGVKWLPVGCRGGGCGVCRVIVRSGSYETGRMNKRLVTSDDESRVFALACKLYPTSDLEIELAPVQRSTA
jgi:ferredoxin